MDIQDLRIFARVAAVHNLTAVAAELKLTTGTVSKRLQGLEKTLNTRLLDRTTRSIRVTEEGRTFLARVERILVEIDLAQDEVQASSGHPAGQLRISVPTAVACRIVMPAVVSFMTAYPEIDIRADVTDRIVNLHEEGYDATIRTGELGDSPLKAKRLAADRIVLVAHPRYIERRGCPVRPADLGQHDCLLHGDLRTWTLHAAKSQTSVDVKGRLSSDSSALLRQAALNGLGILRTSELAVADDLANGRLVRLLPDHVMSSAAGVWALYPNAKHPLPRLRVFLDHVAEWCRENLAVSGRVDSVTEPPASGLVQIADGSVSARRDGARRVRGPQPQ